MKSLLLAGLTLAIIVATIGLWIFMPTAPRVAQVLPPAEIHNGTTCALKAGDIRHDHGKTYIVEAVYWDDSRGWIADETLLTEL